MIVLQAECALYSARAVLAQAGVSRDPDRMVGGNWDLGGPVALDHGREARAALRGRGAGMRIYPPPDYFDGQYPHSWIESPFVKISPARTIFDRIS